MARDPRSQSPDTSKPTEHVFTYGYCKGAEVVVQGSAGDIKHVHYPWTTLLVPGGEDHWLTESQEQLGASGWPQNWPIPFAISSADDTGETAHLRRFFFRR